MIDVHAFLGLPIDFKGLCKIYPPKMKDVLQEKNYPVYRKVLMSSQEDIEDDFTEMHMDTSEAPAPFDYLFELSKSDIRLKKVIEQGLSFFIHEPVTILLDNHMIFIGDIQNELTKVSKVEDLRILKQEDYFEFQNTLRKAIGEKEVEPYNPDENPRVKYFKAKIRLRDKVKANSKNGLTLGSTLAVICCMDLGITPLNAGELSQASIAVLMRYYQEKFKYDVDLRSLIAGADAKKVKPQNWIRNIDDL